MNESFMWPMWMVTRMHTYVCMYIHNFGTRERDTPSWIIHCHEWILFNW